MAQVHLEYKDRVNLGSYYTPPSIVDIAWDMIDPHITSETIILDSACGYGDFLRYCGQAQTIGADLDKDAINTARQSNDNRKFIRTNSLSKVSRSKFRIPSQSKLIIVGNPPYNDKTSLIRHDIKCSPCNIDKNLECRDLGISFLRSYDMLKADIVCVLHPLSYLIKPTNFRLLKAFAENYKLVEGLIISSWEFPESAKLTPFPIVLALYQRAPRDSMEENIIKSFEFKVLNGSSFRLCDFDYITDYVDKYPRKSDTPLFPDESPVFFWTMRDINALKRNRTFVPASTSNTITIDKRKLDYYVYVDVFKRNLHRVPFYFGNCNVLIDNDLFKECRSSFIKDTIDNHPYLRRHFQTELPEKEQVESEIDGYFKSLLGAHHVR